MRFFFLLLALSILFVEVALGNSLDSESQFSQAISLFNRGDYSESSALLENLIKVEPLNDLYWFNEGNALYKLGDFSKSIVAYDHAINLKSSLSPVCQLYKAKGLRKLGRISEAIQIISELSGKKLLPGIAEEVRREMTELNQLASDLTAARPYGLYAESDFGGNSNVANNGDSENKLSKYVAHFFLSGGYHFFKGHALSDRIGYRFFWEEVMQDLPDRFVTQSIDDQLILENGGWLLQAGPHIEEQYIGGQPLLINPGTSVLVQTAYDNWRIGFYYDTTETLAGSATYNYLIGRIQAAKFSVAATFGSLDAEASYTYVSAESGDLVFTNGTVPLGNFSQGPGAAIIWNLSDRLAISGRYLFLYRTFKNSVQPIGFYGFYRNDFYQNAILRFNAWIGAGVSAFLSSEATLNVSSMTQSSPQDRNYNKFVNLVGLSWDALP